MDDKVGFVAEVTKGLCQKAEVAMPEELVGADGEVGVEKYFQAGFFSENITLKSAIGQSHSEARKYGKRSLEMKELRKAEGRLRMCSFPILDWGGRVERIKELRA